MPGTDGMKRTQAQRNYPAKVDLTRGTKQGRNFGDHGYARPRPGRCYRHVGISLAASHRGALIDAITRQLAAFSNVAIVSSQRSRCSPRSRSSSETKTIPRVLPKPVAIGVSTPLSRLSTPTIPAVSEVE